MIIEGDLIRMYKKLKPTELKFKNSQQKIRAWGMKSEVHKKISDYLQIK